MRKVLHSRHRGAILIFTISIVGCALAIYAYSAPLTGVTGSLGALIVIVATLILAAGAILSVFVSKRGWQYLLLSLIFLGLVGTGFAGLLLHRWWIIIAMAIGLVGLVMEAVSTRQEALLKRRYERSA